MKLNKNLFLEIIRYLLILLFVYTCFHKIADFGEFERNLLKSKLIADYTNYIKYSLPISEIVVIILLIPNKFLKGLYASAFLLIAFTVYLIALNNFSLYDGCSCGGVFNKMSYPQHLLTNAFFIIINLIAIFIYEKKE